MVKTATQTLHGQGTDPQINPHLHISAPSYKANKIPCLSTTLLNFVSSFLYELLYLQRKEDTTALTNGPRH